MAKISKISLKNYKSLRDVELELKPLNILIGTNGSGKSNLLDFFRLLKDAAEGQLSRHINREGGFGDVMWWGASNEVKFSVEFYIPNPLSLRSQFEKAEPTSIFITLEKIYDLYSVDFETINTQLDTRIDNSNYFYLQIEHGRLAYLGNEPVENIDANIIEEFKKTYNPQEFYISQLRDPMRFSLLNNIRTILADFVVYRGFSAGAIENVHQAQTLDALYPLRLEPDLSNLSSILHALQNDARYETALEDLTDYLNLAFPEISKVDTPQSAAGKIELRWRNKDFQGKSLPAFSMSDGMIRFLGLATLLVLPDPPALIAIDEPEIGLHPKLIPLLAALLKQASTRTQIVVTTHSPELLNSESITLDDIVLVNKEDGATTFDRPDAVRLERWLENYSIGHLWMIGKLGQRS
ncbi:MAG: AAA family ATPase [Aggregatilineales bacterium]